MIRKVKKHCRLSVVAQPDGDHRHLETQVPTRDRDERFHDFRLNQAQERK